MNPSDWKDERFELAYPIVGRVSALSRHLQGELQGGTYFKTDSSPVTVVDLCVQILVALFLKEHFPQDRLVAEETAEPLLADPTMLTTVLKILEPYVQGPLTESRILESFQESSGSEQCAWILDPIDGTKGFLRGDQFAIALAYLDNSVVRFGLLGCPRLAASGVAPGPGVVGAAYLGRGCWQRELSSPIWERLSVSSTKDPEQGRLLRSYEASHTNEPQIEALVSELNIVAPPVRMDSQAKYMLLARGDAEVVIRCLSAERQDYRERTWDQAAGSIMVTEAGGTISDLRGKPLDFSTGTRLTNNIGVLATNGSLQQPILDGLAGVNARPGLPLS